MQLQIVPHARDDFFRVVIFVKDKNGNNIDANISLVAKLRDGKEAVFLLAPKQKKISAIYPEKSSKFLHRLERGVFMAQSKNKKLANATEIVVRARVEEERAEKRMRIESGV